MRNVLIGFLASAAAMLANSCSRPVDDTSGRPRDAVEVSATDDDALEQTTALLVQQRGGKILKIKARDGVACARAELPEGPMLVRITRSGDIQMHAPESSSATAIAECRLLLGSK